MFVRDAVDLFDYIGEERRTGRDAGEDHSLEEEWDFRVGDNSSLRALLVWDESLDD